jgi:ComF family protein
MPSVPDLHRLLDHLLDLLFPDRCGGCGRRAGLLCRDCRGALRRYPPFDPPPGLDAAAVAFFYDGALPRLLYRLKYDNRRRVAGPLADLLADWYLNSRPLPPGALLAVPLHRDRLRERGFNQAHELAVRLAARSGLPLIDGLQRVRATGHQAALGRAARAVNLNDAFIWQSAAAPPPQIILVDDVLTTGATMVACAAALRAAGSRRISGLALARSDPGRSRALSRAAPAAARSAQTARQ